MTTLYHVTSAKNLPGIQTLGMRDGSYWSDDNLVDYYSETVRDDGEVPIILCLHLSDLDPDLLRPDLPGIEEPISGSIGKSEAEIHELWSKSEKDWKASLDIIGALVCSAPIPAGLIWLEDEQGFEPS